MIRARCLGAAALVAALVALVLPTAAAAQLDLPPGGVKVELLDSAGNPDTRAAAHPDRMLLNIDFSVNGALEHIKSLTVDLPAGFSGDPSAVELCPSEFFWEKAVEPNFCDTLSQVGQVETSSPTMFMINQLWSIEPGPDQAGLFGAGIFQPLTSALKPRADGNGISIVMEELSESQTGAFTAAHIELWGVPSDHQGLGAPRRPLLTNPTRCDGDAPTVTVRARTWQHPERLITASGSTGLPLTGCAGIPFDPKFSFTLTNPATDSPTGVGIEVEIPPNDAPDGRATSQLRGLDVALPEGIAISPGGAVGLGSCTDAQLGAGSDDPATCPVSSRVGSAEILTPATSQPMKGAIYLGQSRAGDRFRLFIAARGPGAMVKTVATLRPDAQTGRLTTTMSDLPQIPLERMVLSFDGGPNALLATPRRCGTVTAAATFVPYSGTPNQQRSSAVDIPCPSRPPFNPGLSAGSLDNGAGKATAFSATISRRDGEALPERIEFALPPGLSTALGDVDPCSATASACPAGARIGTASVAMGPGPNPARLGGDVFLTTPYKSAPFGVAIALKTSVGPFDFGTTMLRGTIEPDPQSGQVTVKTDALPTEIEGLPVRVRELTLRIDRPGFLHNPTSCEPKSVSATIRSTEAQRATPSVPFAVRGCVNLPFKPSFALRLIGKRQLRKGGRPGLEISGSMPPANANLKAATIALPKQLKLDASKLGAICTRRDAERRRCPKAAQIGTATGAARILKSALKGEVYAVQPKDGGQPDVWTVLHGSGLDVVLKGESATEKKRAQTSFTDLPDLPLSRFSLRFAAGTDGVFTLSARPCKGGHALKAPVEATGHNLAQARFRTALAVPGGCGK